MQLHPVFKPLIAAVVGGWLAMGAATAFAQMTPQTADMSVTGTVDFGTTKLIDLPANAYYSLGSKDVALDVHCNANKRVAFSVLDMQQASRITDAAMQTAIGAVKDKFVSGFGTAVVDGTPVNLGSYALELTGITVDGVSRPQIYSDNNGATWIGGAALISTEGVQQFTGGGGGGVGTTPAQGMLFHFPLRVRAALNYGSRLQVAQDTPLNGQAVFSISYQ